MDIKTMSISQIASEISRDWKSVNFAAVPYLGAMHTMDSINDSVGYDAGRSTVLYFLSNSSAWRGETARNIKAELKHRLAKK